MSSFRYDRERWYKSYILGQKESSKYLTLGKEIDQRIQDDPTFLPELPRYELMQHHMRVMFNGIQLMGTPDGINIKKNKQLADFKTGRIPWTQKKAEDTGQLLMYLLLIYITMKIKPEEFDCYIHWLESEDLGDFSVDLKKNVKIRTFKVKHTMADILAFGNEIIKTYKEMGEYLENYPQS